MGRFRTRLPQLLSLWLGTAVVEGVMYYFLLSQPFMRDFFAPFAVAVLVAAVVGTWRLVRPRAGRDRRVQDRRAHERRAGE